MRRKRTVPRSLGRRQPGPVWWRPRSAGASLAPGRGRPSGASAAGRPAHQGPGGEVRPRSGKLPARASAVPRARGRRAPPRRTGMSRTARRTTGPRAGRARLRSSARSYRLDQAARQLAERRQGAHAGLVVARDDVVQAKAEDCVEHQWNQYLARYGQPDAAVSLEAVELFLDHLSVARKQLGQVRAQPLGAGRLHAQVERGELDIAQAPQVVPERLDADFQYDERIAELVEGGAELLDGGGGQVSPSFDQQLGLGRKPVLEVADGDSGPGGYGSDAGSGEAALQERFGGGVDDLVSRTFGRGGPGHTYVLLYRVL